MPAAQTTAEVAKKQEQRRTQGPVGTSARSGRVDPPSGEWRTYQPGNFMKLSVPSNWDQIGGNSGTVTYAPDGGYAEGSGFTHGLQVGVARGSGGNLQSETDRLLQGFAQSNPNLRRQNGYSRTTIGGRQGLTTTLSNVSANGAQEAVNMSTAQLRDGSVLFLIGVAPASEARTYLNTFNQVRQSVQLNDR
jgi:hypothetical protein